MKRMEKLVTISCVMALIALPLMLWSLVDPRPMPIIVAMSVGQVIGTLSLALYVVAIVLDLRAARVLSKADPPAPDPPA
jgi:hypothetical protein